MRKTPLSIILSLVAIVVLASSACNLSSLSTSTTALPTTAVPTAATNTTPTATSTVPSGIPVSANRVEFSIPAGLGNSAAADTVAEVKESAGGPGFDVAPVHYKFTIQGYPAPGGG